MTNNFSCQLQLFKGSTKLVLFWDLIVMYRVQWKKKRKMPKEYNIIRKQHGGIYQVFLVAG